MNAKIKELWEKKKQEGLIIYSSRGSGKTTTMLEIAIEESKKHKVAIWCMHEAHKNFIESELKYKHKILHPNKIKVFSYKNTNDHAEALKLEPDYNFYDEIKIYEKQPKSLIIRSFLPDDNIYIFNVKSNSLLSEERLNELKSQLTSEQWEAEFMSNVIS